MIRCTGVNKDINVKCEVTGESRKEACFIHGTSKIFNICLLRLFIIMKYITVGKKQNSDQCQDRKI